jgi:hypothetical protein
MVKRYFAEQYGDLDAYIVDKMLFTVKDDRSSLSNASVDQVHKLFTEWVWSDEARAERKTAGYGLISYPRYEYCVHVDARALDTCLEWLALAREDDGPWPQRVYLEHPGLTAYVNMIRAEESLHLTPELTKAVIETCPEDEEIEDPDDRSPISVKMELSCINPAFYTRMCT